MDINTVNIVKKEMHAPYCVSSFDVVMITHDVYSFSAGSISYVFQVSDLYDQNFTTSNHHVYETHHKKM